MESAVSDRVPSFREEIAMQSRWPEMVTFEEMNLELPQTNMLEILGRLMLVEEVKSGFMTVARKRIN